MNARQNVLLQEAEDATSEPGEINPGLCHFCRKAPATWSYMPGLEEACDECVPRGCDCNQEPKDGDFENLTPSNWIDPTDARGRKFPCCEWSQVAVSI